MQGDGGGGRPAGPKCETVTSERGGAGRREWVAARWLATLAEDPIPLHCDLSPGAAGFLRALRDSNRGDAAHWL